MMELIFFLRNFIYGLCGFGWQQWAGCRCTLHGFGYYLFFHELILTFKKEYWDEFWTKRMLEISEMEERRDNVARKQVEFETVVILMKNLRHQLSTCDDGDMQARLLSRIILSFLSYRGNHSSCSRIAMISRNWFIRIIVPYFTSVP